MVCWDVFACCQKPAPHIPLMTTALMAHEAPRPRTKALLLTPVLARRSPDDVPHAKHGPVGHPNLWRYLTEGAPGCPCA